MSKAAVRRVVPEAGRDESTFAMHDAKNLLGVIGANVAWLRGNDAEGKLGESLSDIEHACTRLADLLHQAIDAAPVSGIRAAVTLADLVRDAARPFGRVADREKVDLEIEEASGRVVVDPARVGRVVENLLENALRHAGEGGTVRVKVAAEADDMTLSIEDTGVGFHPGEAPAPGHHGLGLAFCRNVVHEHAGTLTLDRSDALHGARVKVSLPRHRPRISERPRLSLVPGP